MGAWPTESPHMSVFRAMFLVAVAKTVPDVLATLRDEILPSFVEAKQETEARATDRGAWERDLARYAQGDEVPELCDNVADLRRWGCVGLSGTETGLNLYPDLKRLKAVLVAWGGRWHLDTEWVYDAALGQLMAWSEHPDATRSAAAVDLKWTHFPAAAWFPAGGENRRFSFEHEGWDWLTQTADMARDVIRADFERALDEYFSAKTLERERSGWRGKPVELRSLALHLQWLARYQVGREPWPQIAATADRQLIYGRKVPVGARWVSGAVRETARLLGLRLDPVRKAGRPRGAATRTTTFNVVAPESRRR